MPAKRTRSNRSSKSSTSSSQGRPKLDRKLAVMKSDFEKQVESNFTQFDATVAKLAKQIEESYDMFLFELPSYILNMTLADFNKCKGNPSELADKEIDDMLDSLRDDTSCSASNQMEQEDSLGPLPPTGFKTQTKHRSRKGQHSATPGAGFTPKFDPRLPITPMTKGARHPRKGEEAVHMSKKGSPLLGFGVAMGARGGNARTPGLSNGLSTSAAVLGPQNEQLHSRSSIENMLMSSQKFTSAEASRLLGTLYCALPNTSKPKMN